MIVHIEPDQSLRLKEINRPQYRECGATDEQIIVVVGARNIVRQRARRRPRPTRYISAWKTGELNEFCSSSQQRRLELNLHHDAHISRRLCCLLAIIYFIIYLYYSCFSEVMYTEHIPSVDRYLCFKYLHLPKLKTNFYQLVGQVCKEYLVLEVCQQY